MEKLIPNDPMVHVKTIIKQHRGATITVIVILRDQDGDYYTMMDNKTIGGLPPMRMPKMPSGIRVQKSDLPRYVCACPYVTCVYNQSGFCDDPYINNGNSDSHCSKMSNRDILKVLAGIPLTKKGSK